MFCDFFKTFSLKNDVNVPSKSMSIFFVGILKLTDGKSRIRIRKSVVQKQMRESGSITNCHGSERLQSTNPRLNSTSKALSLWHVPWVQLSTCNWKSCRVCAWECRHHGLKSWVWCRLLSWRPAAWGTVQSDIFARHCIRIFAKILMLLRTVCQSK